MGRCGVGRGGVSRLEHGNPSRALESWGLKRGRPVFYPSLKAERASFASLTRLSCLNARSVGVCTVTHPRPANLPCVKTHKPQINLKSGESKGKRMQPAPHGSRLGKPARGAFLSRGGQAGATGRTRGDSVCSAAPGRLPPRCVSAFPGAAGAGLCGHACLPSLFLQRV